MQLSQVSDDSLSLSKEEKLCQVGNTSTREYTVSVPTAMRGVVGVNACVQPEMTLMPNLSKEEQDNKMNGNTMDNCTGNANDATLAGHTTPHQGSPNRAIFEFKHQDTDVEESPRLERKGVANLTKKGFSTIIEKDTKPAATFNCNKVSKNSKNLRNVKNNLNSSYSRNNWNRKIESCDESESENLQEIIDSAILDPNWLKAGSDGFDNGSLEGGSDEQAVVEVMDTGSEEDHRVVTTEIAKPVERTKIDSSIKQLVTGAEHLVQATPLPSPIVSPRLPIASLANFSRTHSSPRNLAPLHFGLSTENDNKQQRIQSWLATQARAPSLIDSCDASGEMTTGESENDSSSDSNDFTHTTQIAKDLPQSVVSTPVTERSTFPLMNSDSSKVRFH